MELTEEMIQQLKADLSKARTYSDLMGSDGAIKKILKNALVGIHPYGKECSMQNLVNISDMKNIHHQERTVYAKGMTTRDIQSHVEELYGLDISPGLVSEITNKIVEMAIQWQGRILEPIYAIVFFDAIFYKVREEGKIKLKAAYTLFGNKFRGKERSAGIVGS